MHLLYLLRLQQNKGGRRVLSCREVWTGSGLRDTGPRDLLGLDHSRPSAEGVCGSSQPRAFTHCLLVTTLMTRTPAHGLSTCLCPLS